MKLSKHGLIIRFGVALLAAAATPGAGPAAQGINNAAEVSYAHHMDVSPPFGASLARREKAVIQ